jgi:hypothetical protein
MVMSCSCCTDSTAHDGSYWLADDTHLMILIRRRCCERKTATRSRINLCLHIVRRKSQHLGRGHRLIQAISPILTKISRKFSGKFLGEFSEEFWMAEMSKFLTELTQR